MGDDPGTNRPHRRILSAGLDERPGTGRGLNALGASVLLHAAAFLAILLVVASPRESRSTSAPPPSTEGLIWTMAPGPGGGGGGGGNRRPEPPQLARSPGADQLAVRVAAAPVPAPESDEPSAAQQRLVIPAVPTTAGLVEVPGVLASASMSVPGSRGPGSGPGAGGGDGGGDTGGRGDGLGDGSIAGTGGDVYEAGSGATMPQVIHDPRPGYTSQAMQAKVQGIVLLEAVVLPDGSVGPVRVARSLDQRFGLDEEAVRTIRRWRFLPGMRGSKPVAVRVGIEMTFTIR
jgi:TonB family protein